MIWFVFSVQDIVGVDLKGTIRPTLNALKNIVIDKCHDARCVRLARDCFWPPWSMFRAFHRLNVRSIICSGVFAGRTSLSSWTSRPRLRRISLRLSNRYVREQTHRPSICSASLNVGGSMRLGRYGSWQRASLESKVKKQEELYRGERARLETNLNEQVRPVCLEYLALFEIRHDSRFPGRSDEADANPHAVAGSGEAGVPGAPHPHSGASA
jgi:hypothetical protein